MGKDLKHKELGVGISQRKDGLYTARFVSKRTGKPVQNILINYKSAESGMRMQSFKMSMEE